MKETYIGKKINSWKILSYFGKDKFGQDRYVCECSCGKRQDKNIYDLLRGKTKCCRSCSSKKRKTGYYSIRNMPEYKRLKTIYSNMKSRCYNYKNPKYKTYGKKGIYICDEWLEAKKGFSRFFHWSLNNGYSKNLSIDRIDYTREYSPKNCRWTTQFEQQNNKSSNVFLEYNGEKISLKKFCLKYNLNEQIIRQRYNRFGIKDPNLLILKKLPLKRKRKHFATINGKTMHINEWCEILGLKKSTIANRIKAHKYTPEEAILKPLKNGSETKEIIKNRTIFLKNS